MEKCIRNVGYEMTSTSILASAHFQLQLTSGILYNLRYQFN